MNSKAHILHKIIHRHNVQHIFQQLKKNGKKIVFTNGCFDIVHPGHIHYLMEASELGDILVVAINSDDSVRRLKGPTRPIIPEKERCLHMASFEFVDYVLIFDEDTPENIIKLIQPDVLVKGSDYRIDEIAGASYVLQQGGKVITIPLIEGYSTTSLLRKLDKKS